jgi:hypothetical protein
MAVTLAHLRDVAQSLKRTGSFAFTASRIAHADVNALFSQCS